MGGAIRAEAVVRQRKLTRIKAERAGGGGSRQKGQIRPTHLTFGRGCYCTPQINIFPKV
jgi:hypothetical protein